MARLIRQWPFLRNHCFCHAAFNYLLSESLILSIKATSPHLSLTIVTASNRNAHFLSRGGNASDSDSESYKSRKQKKREARLAIRWGMELASSSPPQIKRIIKVASLEKDRPGPDVRQGKRRQYNYIGRKLLRDGFSGLEEKIIGDDNEESGESEYDGSHEYIDIATSWFGGLINRHKSYINEVYALRSIDFDSQELHKHVRRMHAVQERKGVAEENEQEVETAITAAKNSLARFLHGLDEQMPSESNHIDL
uniref:Uncharacterized protein n=1 Tax=Populus trichocarpa TaxID=3694 RepID=A0A2K2BC46_POPTR